jgi:16S rRNA (guanine1207-N2)-methyltransferase
MTEDHYFTADPSSRSRPRTARLTLPDVTLELATDSGVFANGHIDRGTDLLLRSTAAPRAGDLLDLGCGYGAIALTLAIRSPSSTVWAIDVNRRARALCQANADSAGLTNVVVADPSDVSADLRFAAIYSNPPIRLGKEPVRRLLTEWIQRLLPGAHAFLVVHRYLGSDSLAAWLAGSGLAVERLRSRGGYRVLDVHTAPASTHHGHP